MCRIYYNDAQNLQVMSAEFSIFWHRILTTPYMYIIRTIPIIFPHILHSTIIEELSIGEEQEMKMTVTNDVERR